jgi:hypothetical protein
MTQEVEAVFLIRTQFSLELRGQLRARHALEAFQPLTQRFGLGRFAETAQSLVIQVSRLSDGSRKLMQVSEIVGMEGDIITMQDIFVYEREGMAENEKVLGRFKATGIRPRFSDRLKSYGIDLSSVLFSNLNDKEPARGAPRW